VNAAFALKRYHPVKTVSSPVLNVACNMSKCPLAG
jgi:hypothetical protein